MVWVMATSFEGKLEIKAWEETPTEQFDGGMKLTKAVVALSGSADGLSSASFQALMFYRADGTSTYVTLMRVVGTLSGRSGSFVLQGSGTFDGRVARVESVVVEGSGTGELAGLRGTSESVSSHEDYPFMPLTLAYDIE